MRLNSCKKAQKGYQKKTKATNIWPYPRDKRERKLVMKSIS